MSVNSSKTVISVLEYVLTRQEVTPVSVQKAIALGLMGEHVKVYWKHACITFSIMSRAALRQWQPLGSLVFTKCIYINKSKMDKRRLRMFYLNITSLCIIMIVFIRCINMHKYGMFWENSMDVIPCLPLPLAEEISVVALDTHNE